MKGRIHLVTPGSGYLTLANGWEIHFLYERGQVFLLGTGPWSKKAKALEALIRGFMDRKAKGRALPKYRPAAHPSAPIVDDERAVPAQYQLHW